MSIVASEVQIQAQCHLNVLCTVFNTISLSISAGILDVASNCKKRIACLKAVLACLPGHVFWAMEKCILTYKSKLASTAAWPVAKYLLEING